MQEQTQETRVETPAKPKLPVALLAVIAIVGLLGIGGIVTAYVLMHNNYAGYLDQLKAAAAATSEKFAKGDATAEATLEDQYNFYVTLNDEVANLSATLEKLNGNYPLLPGRADEKSAGIYELKTQMSDTYKKLGTLKECIGEDASVRQKLSELLAVDASTPVLPDMTALASRNAALDASISGISFSGPLEDRRAEFASSIKKRVDVLGYLVKDAEVRDGLLALLANKQALPADLITQSGDLKTLNEALTDPLGSIDVQGIPLTAADLGAKVSERKTVIEACAGYFAELKTVQDGVAEFCRKLAANPVSGTKYTEQLAGYFGYLTQFKALETQVKTINDKKEYSALPIKRAVADLGMTEAGQEFLKYEAALDAMNTAMTNSGNIEKQIDSLLKNTKLTLPAKINALLALSDLNTGIIRTNAEGAPAGLTQGFAAFIAGCQERATFLNEFMAYVDCKVKADGYSALSSDYLKKKKSYLDSAAYWATIAGHESDVDHYKQLANDQAALASSAKKGYNNCLKEANTHKAAYEASRKKYLAMFAS